MLGIYVENYLMPAAKHHVTSESVLIKHELCDFISDALQRAYYHNPLQPKFREHISEERINLQIVLFLLSLSPNKRSEFFSGLGIVDQLSQIELFRLNGFSKMVQPDFLLLSNEKHALLGEMKVDVRSIAHKYDSFQLLKYCCLAERLIQWGLAEKITHFVWLSESLRNLEKKSQMFSINGSNVTINLDAAFATWENSIIAKKILNKFQMKLEELPDITKKMNISVMTWPKIKSSILDFSVTPELMSLGTWINRECK